MSKKSCIVHGKEFQQLMKETNLPEGQLDLICYDYQQIKGEEKLPTINEVNNIVTMQRAKEQAIKNRDYIIKVSNFTELAPTVEQMLQILDNSINQSRVNPNKKSKELAFIEVRKYWKANSGIVINGKYDNTTKKIVVNSVQSLRAIDSFTDTTDAFSKEELQDLSTVVKPMTTIFSGTVSSTLEKFVEEIKQRAQEANEELGTRVVKPAYPLSRTIKDTNAYVEYLNKYNDSIINKLEKEGFTIEITPDNTTKSLSVAVNNGKVYLFYNPVGIILEEKRIERILAHELTHTVTANAINHYIEDTANDAEKEFVNTIWEYIKELNNDKGITWTFDRININEAPAEYVKEFIAEVMSNAEMQSRLADYKKDDKTSLWQKILNVFRKLIESYLGKSIKNTYLEDIMGTIQLFVNNNKVTNYYQRDSFTETVPSYYEGNITPSENTIFVFGSNPEGRHGAGSAKVAKELFGAQYGIGEGLTGNAYALPTKDLRVTTNKSLRSISPEKITESIKKLYEVAELNPEKQFKVAFRNQPNETTLNGYTGAEMIEMFNNAGPIPSNIIFSKEWFDSGLLKLNQIEEKPEVTITQENPYTVTRVRKSDNSLLKGEYKLNTIGQEQVDDASFLETIDRQLVIGDCVTIDLTPENAIEGIQLLSILETDSRFNAAIADRITYPIPQTLYDRIKKYPGLKINKDGEQYSLMVSPYYIYGFSEKELRLNKQHDNLIQGLAPTKLRACAKIAMFAMSDIVTQIQDGTFDEKEYQELKGKARIDIIKAVSVQKLLDIVKEHYFTYNNKAGIKEENKLITDNWEAFCELGFLELATLENIQLNQLIINEDELRIAEVFDSEEETEVLERTGSAIEAWQIGFRQLGAFSSLSLMLKQYLHTLYKRTPDKDLSDEEIEAGANIVTDKDRYFPVPVDAATATASILKWTRYSTSLKEMIDKLKSQQSLNPWLRPLIIKLESDDETFKAQFFTNFCKYFLSYTIITRQDGKLITKQINENEYAERELEQLTAKEEFPALRLLYLINKDGSVNTTILGELNVFANSTKEPSLIEIEKVLDKLNINYPTDLEALLAVFTKLNIATLKSTIGYIVKNIQKHVDEGNSPDYKVITDNKSNYGKIINLFSQVAGENVESVSYSSGKLHYSYVVPSYLNIITGKLRGNVENYDEFLENEYGRYSWFKKDGKWRNLWLKELAENPKLRQLLDHTVVLTKDGVDYVNKNEVQYSASMIAMYFYEPTSDYAWFRLPMMSNKPSEEYLRFKKYKGELTANGQVEYRTIMKHLVEDVFTQELDRMSMYYERTERGIKEGSRESIASFDKNLQSFQFLSFLNDSRQTDKEFDRLITKRIKNEQLTAEETVQLYKLAYLHIQEGVNNQFANFVQSLKDSRFLEEDEKGVLTVTDKTLAKEVGLWGTTSNILKNLEEFYWNDMFAAINILEITVTDIAYYKDSDDLQKRLAQLHAPYLRPYVQAYDKVNNRPVSDGIYRTIYLKDEVFKSTILSNLKQANKIILDKITDPVEKEYTRRFLADAIKAFEEVNFADAQSFQSPSALRKKLIMFGKWSDEQLAAYERVIKGTQSREDIDVLWTPLKPFVYGHETVDSHTNQGDLKVPVLNKNSEYTIILADAIMNRAGIPNRLAAIYRVMERTQQLNNGIDSVQFESTVKSGLSGVIDISEEGIKAFKNNKNNKELVDNIENTVREQNPDYSEAELQRATDEALVEAILNDAIYVNVGDVSGYNTTVVHELPFEQYGLQQEVPSHFRHEQQWGSQERILVPSDTPNQDEEGNDNYIIVDGVKTKVADAKKEYQELIVKRVEDSKNALIEELHLNSVNKGLQNLALSRLLRDRILEDSRYGADELWAVSINPETMEFNIPLGDPVHADMIEKLINSIIKNRIHKLKIAGGPVVQVTNFGTSDELKIRYYDNNNKVLLTEQEFNALKNKDTSTLPARVKNHLSNYNTDTTKNTYLDYIQAYQVRPAYYECYAPIFNEELFTKYADEEGNINVDLIEKEDPKLLEMIGYRIPTEMKYSCAPLKIVGFLPINSEGIMLPVEWTTLSGSDFDIDKLYIMRHLGKEARTIREKNDDRILDIQWGFLTSLLTMQELFTPGGFETVKRVAYEISAYKLNYELYTLELIRAIKDIKSLAKKKQNLIFALTQIAYHRQNMVAAKLIGIFAVANISHAVMSQGNAIFEPKTNNMGLIIDRGFSIDRHFIGGSSVVIDPIKGFYGERVSHVLAQFLAASVDAVKDPVLNLMNINIQSVNIAITLARLGFGIKQIALFLNQPIIEESIREATVTNRSLATVVRLKLKDLKVKDDIHIDLSFSTSEWENTLLKSRNQVDDIKQLLLAQQLLSYAESFSNITTFTKLNSIASAVGPRIINNLFLEVAMDKLHTDKRLLNDETRETIGNPICGVFHDSQKELADKLFTPDRFVTSTDYFKEEFEWAAKILKYNFDEPAALKLADVVTSLLAGDKLQINIAETVTKFPAEFVRRRDEYRQKFGDNMFLDWIVLDTSDKKLPVLSLKTRGASTEQLLDIKAAFDEVLDNDKEYCLDIVKYIYSRNGFGFSPKTFAKEITNHIKQAIPGYLEALQGDLSVVKTIAPEDLLTQFCLNTGIYTGEFRNGAFSAEGDPRKYTVKFTDKKGRVTEVDPNGIYKVTNGNQVYVQVMADLIDKTFGFRLTENHLKELGYSGNIFEYYKEGVTEDTKPIIETVDDTNNMTQSEVTPLYTDEITIAARVVKAVCNQDADLINKSLQSFKEELSGDIRYLRAQNAANKYAEITNEELTITTPKLGQGIALILLQMEQKGLSADKLIELIIETSEKQNVCN